ncbi:hypothetical protein Taro_001634 [Colocasia esculenta]|uniref:RNA polymerase II C-terminal domain phosphatase-like n=1 Tax=Colocasia esculenta TaxID=4460 RepID=A0A843TIK0_COLES|nr:hypothetical protein [Colocasia esculenta]
MAAITIPRPVLVLDLDNTLLHTIPAVHLAPGEAYLLRRPPPTKPGQQQMFFDMAATHGYLTKLRPFVRTFLREAGAMYDLRICTMGTRDYAHHMARLLDPDGALFSPARIVAREDLKEADRKGLDDVVPGGDLRAVVILDDTVEVWEKHLDNLVSLRPYDYFAGRWRRGKSFAQMRMDEEEAEGGLAIALDLLRRAHEMFLDQGAGGDLREVLRRLRKKPELRVPRR